MAKSEKITDNSPVVQGTIATLVEVFSIESEATSKTLIEQAAMAIYCGKGELFDFDSSPRPASKQEIDEVYAMMKAIKPINLIEALYAAQIVVGHMLGMRKLAQSGQEDQRLGLKLLRLSNDAMERLEKKRNSLVHSHGGVLANMCLQTNS